MTTYTLTSIMSPFVMFIPLLYLETLENRNAQFKSSSLLSHSPLIYHMSGHSIIHQRVQTTCLHASHYHHCHYCQYCNVDFVYSIMSHATLMYPCIHGNSAYLLNILYTWVATYMILGRLECTTQIQVSD